MHATPAVNQRSPWRVRLAALALLLPAALWAQAPIEIKPLPESKHATVTQLGAADLSASDLQAWLDGQMFGVMQKGAVTGAVVVVVKDGEIVLSKGYGYADAGAKKPVDPATTMFRLGEVSSVVTAAAVMQLVEKHKLDLDADINRYLDFSMPVREGKPVTLRDLLTYTAGFEEVIQHVYVTDPKQVGQNEDWLKDWVHPARIYPSGSVPAYSVYGMALAGYIVQRASGQRFEEYAQRHVFDPMGMKHSTFLQSAPAWENMAAAADTRAAEPHAALVLPTPALGLASSGGDMAQLMIALLQYGRSGNAQLLEQATVTSMQAYQRAAIPGLPGMALGLMRMDRDGQVMLGHDGHFNGFDSLVALLPEQHAGIFIATAGGHAGPQLRPLVDRFAMRYFPPLPRLAQPTLATARAHAMQLVGRYESSITAKSSVLALPAVFSQVQISVAADGSLVAPMFGAARWREVEPYRWLDDATGRRLGAVIQNGKASMLSIDTLSPTQVYLPADGVKPATVATGVIVMVAVFALIVLSWPVMAWLGRRHPAWAVPTEHLRGYRVSRLAAVLFLAFALGWYLLLPRLGMPHLDARFAMVFLIGAGAVGYTFAVVLETARAWRGGHGWRRVVGTLLLLDCIAAIAFMLAWHLLSLSPGY